LLFARSEAVLLPISVVSLQSFTYLVAVLLPAFSCWNDTLIRNDTLIPCSEGTPDDAFFFKGAPLDVSLIVTVLPSLLKRCDDTLILFSEGTPDDACFLKGAPFDLLQLFQNWALAATRVLLVLPFPLRWLIANSSRLSDAPHSK
jgi:hypothetical protein